MTVDKANPADANSAIQAQLDTVIKKRKREKRNYIILCIAGVLGFFLIWELLMVTGVISSRILSRPSEIIQLFFRKFSDPKPEGSLLHTNILSSLTTSLIGFGLASVVGVPLGWLMAWYRPVNRLVQPLFEVIRPIPPISWIPLTILWLGIGLKARAFIVFFAALIPCVINSFTGVRLTPQPLINVAKTCGASSFTIFRKVAVPYSLPMVFAGLRVALTNSWSTLVAAEMLASSAGLGYMILMGRSFSRPDLIILGMLVIGLSGAILNQILAFAEKRVLKWRVTND